MTSDKIFLKVNGKETSLQKRIADAATATTVSIYNCAGLTALPDLPAATTVYINNCAGLTVLNAGKDRRGYQFTALYVRKQWRIIAGCRNFSIEDAKKHWRKNAECYGLVETLITQINMRKSA